MCNSLLLDSAIASLLLFFAEALISLSFFSAPAFSFSFSTARLNLLRLIKDFHMTLTGLRGYNEAIITKGGISVKEIDPGTMESKLIKNLYFAGEVLDLDAVTGGYNLQIAWSTGYLAGISAGQDKLFE